MAVAMTKKRIDWAAFGRHVAITREKVAGLTLAAAAREAKVSDATWRKVENGEGASCRTRTLAKILEAIGDDNPKEILASMGRDYEPMELPEIPPIPAAGDAFLDVLKSFPQLKPDDRLLLVDLFNRLTAD